LKTPQKLTAGDTDTGRMDIYERAGGITTLVSQPTGVADPDAASVEFRGASADGSRVFFDTPQKLTADDVDTARSDVYERAGGVTTLVSQPTGVADPDKDSAFFEGASSGGGRVFFTTTQKLTADDTDTARADVYERTGGVTRLATQATGVADPDTNGANLRATSDDGGRAFFETSQKMTADRHCRTNRPRQSPSALTGPDRPRERHLRHSLRGGLAAGVPAASPGGPGVCCVSSRAPA
jgi:hypothetical protein